MRSHRLQLAIRVGVTATLFVSPTFAAEPLTLSRALDLTLERNPALAGLAAEIRARQALTVQAGRLPNPKLGADLENLGGTGDREGFEQTETTLRVSQLVELGGKRSRRQRVAARGQDVAAWDLEMKRRAVLSDTTRAFVRALAAQARLALAVQLEEIARRAVAGVSAQVNAGASPNVEVTRARVALGRNEIETHRAERDLAAARRALAVNWGDDNGSFGQLEGDLTMLTPPPSAADVEARLAHNPELVRSTSEAEERAATLALEQAGRIPDVTIGAGARHFSNNGDFGLVVELSAPIPVFDRNQGAIAAAQHRLEKARADRDAVYLSLRAALAAAYVDLTGAYEEASRLRDHVIPTAQRAFEETVKAYNLGLFRYDDVLDTQRTLFAVRADHLTALENFHTAAAEIERLTGPPSPPPGGEDREGAR